MYNYLTEYRFSVFPASVICVLNQIKKNSYKPGRIDQQLIIDVGVYDLIVNNNL